MATDLEKKLLAGTAYRIFCDELSKHLEATSTLFVNTEWSAEQLRDASNRFHTIKGGAGFFRLTELASAAGQLEKLLGEKGKAELVPLVDTLRNLDSELRAAAAVIPAPAQS